MKPSRQRKKYLVYQRLLCKSPKKLLTQVLQDNQLSVRAGQMYATLVSEFSTVKQPGLKAIV